MLAHHDVLQCATASPLGSVPPPCSAVRRKRQLTAFAPQSHARPYSRPPSPRMTPGHVLSTPKPLRLLFPGYKLRRSCTIAPDIPAVCARGHAALRRRCLATICILARHFYILSYSYARLAVASPTVQAHLFPWIYLLFLYPSSRLSESV